MTHRVLGVTVVLQREHKKARRHGEQQQRDGDENAALPSKAKVVPDSTGAACARNSL
jgi:hypothetical protein